MMAGMIKLTLRLPIGLHKQLKARAQTEKDSLNQTIIETLRKGIAQETSYQETEREKVQRVIREAGLWEPPGPEWPDVEDTGLTHEEIRKMMKGVPPLSEIIIEEREPR
jgi:hypothetical protein